MDDIRIGPHTISWSEVEERFETSGGPGGQHANRNETAVRLRFDITASSLPPEVRQTLIDQLGETVEVSATDSRSQYRNRALARRRLTDRLEQALAPTPPRKPTRPTRASRRRRVESKRARGEIKRMRRKPDREE